jgi:aspartyl-tRNA(Asn)/glutamyl-tRNA(Gln) amidotransferase subunit B
LANWITTDLFSLINETNTPIGQSKLTPLSMAKLVSLVEEGSISATNAKEILSELFQNGGDPQSLIDSLDLGLIDDVSQIEMLIQQILEENPDQVQEYTQGKTPLFQWFVGQVMQAAGGRVNPTTVRQLLSKHLQELSKD